MSGTNTVLSLPDHVSVPIPWNSATPERETTAAEERSFSVLVYQDIINHLKDNGVDRDSSQSPGSFGPKFVGRLL